MTRPWGQVCKSSFLGARSRPGTGHVGFADLTPGLVAAVWLVHGLYNKLLGGSARHLQIVQSVPGLQESTGVAVLALVGALEVAIAVWVVSRRAPRACAATQSVLLLSMNVVELTFARHLLLWPAGLIPVNLAFLALAWTAAGWRGPARVLARLKRHPLAIDAHFHDCLTLTYAVPADVLRPLLSRGLELDTLRGYGFVAVALVQAADLRPAGLPRAVGQDFFLAGYRVFTRFRRADGKAIRGLRILRSDTDKARMVAGGNLLTHYNYHRCAAVVDASLHGIRVAIDTPDHGGDLRVSADFAAAPLPEGSPFPSLREARPFAGPLPFTFDYEAETDAIIAIQARRAHWTPEQVAVTVERMSFFDQPAFRGCTPILAAAFHVSDVEYRWRRGVHHAL
jgi:hypothetical protein